MANNQVQLSESLMEAFERMANNQNVQNFNKSTMVIEGTVVAVKNTAYGLYDIEYLGATFSAYANNKNFTYNVGDNVYVLVPDGDMEKTKIILSAIATADTTRIAIAEDTTSYISFGDNLLFLDWTINSPYTLSTFEEVPYPGRDNLGFNSRNQQEVADAFNSMLKYTHTFDLTYEVKTNIETNRRINGNYGLYLKLPIIQDNIKKVIEINLDTHRMLGNFYNFMSFAKQHFYFELPDNVEIDVSNEEDRKIELRAFVEGFPKPDPNSPPFPQDIFFANIGVSPVKVLTDKERSGNYLKLKAFKSGTNTEVGGFFAENVETNSKDLVPVLYYDGKQVEYANAENKDNYRVYWFIQDYSINVNSDKYHKLGGTGWRILNDLRTDIDNLKEVDEKYQTDKYRYTIEKNKVHCELNYKCVMTINGSETLVDTILIKNLSSKAELTLTSDKDTYYENIGTVELTMTYKEPGITNLSASDLAKYNFIFAWQRFNRDGDPIPDFDKAYKPQPLIYEDGAVKSKISLDIQLIDKLNTFSCTVILEHFYEKENPNWDPENPSSSSMIMVSDRDVIGTRSLSIKTSQEITFGIELENGSPFIKYDWSGTSPLMGNYDGPAIAKTNVIKPIRIAKVTNERGAEFTEDELKVLTVKWKVPSYKAVDGQADMEQPISLIEVKDYNITDWEIEIIDDKAYRVRKGYFDPLRTFDYSIKDLYDSSLTSNTVILEISIKDIIITKYIDFTFMKEGQSGTNGTNFAAQITYGGKAYGEKDSDTGLPHKCQLLYIDNDVYKSYEYGSFFDVLRGCWFLFNPAWIAETDEKSPVGNRLGLLYICDKVKDSYYDKVYLRCEKKDSVGEYEAIAVKNWKDKNGTSINIGDDYAANQFTVNMYSSGELMNATKEVQWDIFDGDIFYEGIISPIEILNRNETNCTFKIPEKPQYVGLPQGKTWEDVWVYEDKTPGAAKVSSYTVNATLQAKVRAKQDLQSNTEIGEGGTIDSPFFIYAYYPIEVTYMSYASHIDNFIPTLTGGFDNVIYASEGLNPEYDNTNPFKMEGVEGLERVYRDIAQSQSSNDMQDYCEYHWSHSSNLGCPQALTNEVLTKSNIIEIRPVEKFMNEVSKNYVKVQVDFNNDVVTELEGKISDLDSEIEKSNDVTDSYNTINNIINPTEEGAVGLFDAFEGVYNEVREKATNSSEVLKETLNLEDKLRSIYKSYKDILDALNNFEGKVRGSEDKQRFDRMVQTLENGYIAECSQELDLLNKIKTKPTEDVYNYIDDIKDAKPNHGTGQGEFNHDATNPPSRYQFTDSELNQSDIYYFYSEYSSFSSIYDKFIAHNNFVTATDYNTIYHNIFYTGGDAAPIKAMADAYKEIYQIIINYLGDNRWTELEDIQTYENTDLMSRQVSFKQLENSLATAFNEIQASQNLFNPFATIINCIEKMNTSMLPFKNYDLGEQVEESLKQTAEIKKQRNETVSVRNVCQFTDKGNIIIHSKPIILLQNRFELGYINDWDGNKLKIDEDGGYIVSPKIAAGRKESDNSFSGMIMGIYKNPNNKADKVGLFGKAQGKQTLFLDALDGSATFGVAGQGQIYIDPTPENGGCIFSGNYYTKYDAVTGKPDRTSHNDKNGQGMLINLKDSYIHFGQSKAYLFSGNHKEHTSTDEGFLLNHEGLSIGEGLRVFKNGEFRFGVKNEEAEEGKKHQYIEFDPTEGKMVIGDDVELTATKISSNALKGTEIIIAENGRIISEETVRGQPCFELTKNSITINGNENSSIKIQKGSIDIGDFHVSEDGVLSATGATIGGELTAGPNSQIGNWRVENLSFGGVSSTGCLNGYSGTLPAPGTTTVDPKIRLMPDKGGIALNGKRGNGGNYVYLLGYPSEGNEDGSNTLYLRTALSGGSAPVKNGALDCGIIKCDDINCNKDKVITVDISKNGNTYGDGGIVIKENSVDKIKIKSNGIYKKVNGNWVIKKTWEDLLG